MTWNLLPISKAYFCPKIGLVVVVVVTFNRYNFNIKTVPQKAEIPDNLDDLDSPR